MIPERYGQTDGRMDRRTDRQTDVMSVAAERQTGI